MQGNLALLTLSVVAGGALAINRGITAAGAYPSAGAGIRGVTRTPAGASGDLVPIDVAGTVLIDSGAAVTNNGPLKVDNQGRVIDQGGSGVIVGYALNGTSAANQGVCMLMVGATA
jgi:hypothetical protein